MTGANLVHIPYRGSGPAALAAVAGEVPLTSTDLTAAHENVKAGNLTALGVTSAQPLEARARKFRRIAEGGVPGLRRPAELHRRGRATRNAAGGDPAVVERDRPRSSQDPTCRPRSRLSRSSRATPTKPSSAPISPASRRKMEGHHQIAAALVRGRPVNRMTYRAPVADIAFTLKHGAGLAPRRWRKAANSPPTTSTPCWRRPAGSRPTCSRRSTPSATSSARRSRMARSPCRPAGRRPIAPGPPPAGTRCRCPRNGAARRCRTRSMPPASRCGIRPRWRSASARC